MATGNPRRSTANQTHAKQLMQSVLKEAFSQNSGVEEVPMVTEN